ncbi:baseplate assembly protein [Vulcaniibacterium tengchongense]|uniref:Phage-related baseplate assembly protein n=1 Tax=Vulcaniibacterium tengchongense TaxID=1273429 RepID=A0A3N4V0G3_9GAMM|nr:baseplate J/gp47 family protein [Vulcaniibacterium tengchongense]RPE74625.1 phage-related baseplate assembly protein [Vulcaniibacterium tengchongense]
MTYTAVDLSRLPAPEVVEQIDYEVILAEQLADLRKLWPEFSGITESDPVYKLLQLSAYREMQVRQRNNESVKAVMLAYARGADLDQLGALLGVERLQLDPGDPDRGIPPTMETDTDFRRRIQLAPEGFSVAGPEGAYIYHALGAHPAVLDASATSPEPDDIRDIVAAVLAAHDASPGLVAAMDAALAAAKWPGDVTVTVLSRDGDGSASPELISAVAARLNDDAVRPLTDNVTVRGAQIVPFEVEAVVYTYAGPDSALVLAESKRRLDRYIADSHRLGRDVPRSGLYSVLHSEGVQRVELISPAHDIVIDRTQAPYCTRINIIAGGIDE